MSDMKKNINPVMIEDGIKQVFNGLNIDLTDPNFKDSPKRITRAFWEILEGVFPEAQKELENELGVTFPCQYDQIISVNDIYCWSVCPHHFLPVYYQLSIAYLPNDKVLGVSKLPRIAVLLAKRPVLQEQLTKDIADFIMEKTNARGVGVVVKGEHLCMRMRGIKSKDANVITSVVYGEFRDNEGLKDEFLQLSNI